MMVRMSLPLAVLRSKLRRVCARTLTLPTVEVIESLHEVLGTDDPLEQRTALSSVLPTKAALSNLY
jgi:hypothetical protein